MPPVQIPTEDSSAFTVIDPEAEKLDEIFFSLPRNVNVVKPLRHDDTRVSISEHAEDEMTAPSAPPAPPAPPPNTILDPKFSRALDFKLRRLKEKEILQANLRRPTRYRPRNGALAASNPNISGKEPNATVKVMSHSHPRIDVAGAEGTEKTSPKMDNPASPGSGPYRRGRARQTSDGDKPRFVTTVKAGQFLLPPPEIACLLGLETLYPPQERDKIVYSYASKPKAVAPRTKRSLPKRKEQNGCPSLSLEKSAAPPGEPAAPPGRSVAPPVRPVAPPDRPPRAGALFGDVRALVAGVVGVTHMLDKPTPGAANVMHDRRVVRGSTFASHPHHLTAAGDGADGGRRRRAQARRAAARLRPASPPPAPGRRHLPVQTDYYLEELFEKGAELEVGVQTDLFRERPATPAYVPAKSGADAHTQVYPGELFEFDAEVQPLLEALVGRCAEQALAEVAHEEELAALREQRRRYGELRDAERCERARLAAAHERLHREKERRVAQAREGAAAARGARDAAAAHALVHGYVAALLPAVLAGLRDQGYLVERARRGADEEFMPWLVAEVSREVEAVVSSRAVLAEIVRDVVEARAELHRAAAEGAPPPADDSDTPRSDLLGEAEEMPLDE